MRPTTRPRLSIGALALLLAAAVGTGPARAEDRFRLDVRMARQAERHQSREADSLGLSVSVCTVGAVDCEFRVMDVPFGKTLRPVWQVFGTTETASRVFVAGASATGSGGPVPTASGCAWGWHSTRGRS